MRRLPSSVVRQRRAFAILTAGFTFFIMSPVVRAEAAKVNKAAKPETVSYAAQPGDTIYEVADHYLSDPHDWRVLARLNHVDAPRRLKPGTLLKLPVALLKRDPLMVRVLAASGDAERISKTVPSLPLAEGASLGEGDAISTGSDGFVTIELEDGTHLTLTPRSTLALGTLRRTVLTGRTERDFSLVRGEVESEVEHLTKPDDRFEIHAPSIVAGVRGTHFRVNFDPLATTVEVLDGKVAVGNAETRARATKVKLDEQAPAPESELVPAGYGSVTRGGAVGAPVALLPAPMLAHPAKIQDGPQVEFDLQPVAGATRYRLDIARDAGTLDLIRETRTETPHASFADLADGTYFVRVSAIDGAGLQGVPRVYAFERRRNGVDASAGRAAGARSYEFRWLASRPGVDTHFRFVLSRNEDLGDPLVDAVDISGHRFVVTGLPAGVYYWTVIAEQFENGRFYETAAGVRSFTLAY
ncbi:FecR domain-containing protein [Trinickia symbiotica]|uniref:LysM peptidoglycan-binding domain-containing protein n=1 Tax=Trinickia symbiotica TaxID=863227 RepID=A0A2N7XBE5_9BURK|nr:LysM peptidoglycan-binding domain-containing protein [Trinickia symbiotica]